MANRLQRASKSRQLTRNRAPDHFHEYEEVLVVLQGEGRMWAGETSTGIATGSCVFLPRGQVHCVENTGDGELRLLGVFHPAGSPAVRYSPDVSGSAEARQRIAQSAQNE